MKYARTNRTELFTLEEQSDGLSATRYANANTKGERLHLERFLKQAKL
ncbi:MAG: hypothetical protein RM347_019180 [Nostoc sp. ChiQUE02]|nr:hypothetical protein [Nostoc sp. ChiQUE02]MDZ8234341.1 hypothetical protein [Nostoc sp. ChiQUE02]